MTFIPRKLIESRIVNDWNEIRQAIMNGGCVLWNDFLLIGFELINNQYRYLAKNRFHVDCVVYENGDVSYLKEYDHGESRSSSSPG